MDLQKIKNIAKNRGVSIQFIAESLQMTRANLHYLIKENRISANQLESLSHILETPVTEFFDKDYKTGPEKNIILQESEAKYIVSDLKKKQSIELMKLQIKNLELEVKALKKEIELKNEIINLLRERKK